MKIKSFCPRLRKQLGFTMIELLIVIAILGILAVAVLSAINPIEQINRGRDTGSRSDAEQLISAIDRFYAMTGYYPWNAAVGDPATVAWTEADTTFLALQAPLLACPILYRLSEVPAGFAGDCNNEPGTQELKLGFVSKLDGTADNPLYVYHAANAYDSTYVCFAPQSNAFQQEAAERVSSDTLPGDYPPTGVGYARTDNICGPEGNCICLP